MMGRELWERQAGEGSKAFAAFQSYRDQPPMDRSLRQLAITLGRDLRQLAEWSSRWGWTQRSAAWDDEQDRLIRAVMVRERIQLGKRLAATGALMQARMDRDGHEVSLGPGQSYADEMSMSEAIRLIEEGARLETIGRGGLADERLETGHAGERPPIDEPVVNPIVAAVQRNAAIIGEMAETMRHLMALIEPHPSSDD